MKVGSSHCFVSRLCQKSVKLLLRAGRVAQAFERPISDDRQPKDRKSEARTAANAKLVIDLDLQFHSCIYGLSANRK